MGHGGRDGTLPRGEMIRQVATGAPIAFSLGTIVSTLAGGVLAMRARGHLKWILAFTTGVLLGVVTFDLLPEIFRLIAETQVSTVRPMIAMVTAFLLFRFLEDLLFAAVHDGPIQEDAEHGRTTSVALLSERNHRYAGVLAALALIGHSVFDGVSIGVAFQVSASVGVTVAVAVIAHDFADGINTVSVMIAHGNRVRPAFWMLVFDAVAPVVGVLLTRLYRVPPGVLAVYLGFFAGFLLHVATSAAHSVAIGQSRVRVTQLATITAVGAAFAFIVATLGR
jgi:zinc transporter ZupT